MGCKRLVVRHTKVGKKRKFYSAGPFLLLWAGTAPFTWLISAIPATNLRPCQIKIMGKIRHVYATWRIDKEDRGWRNKKKNAALWERPWQLNPGIAKPVRKPGSLFFFFSSALLPLGLHLCLPPGWINNEPSPSSWQLERSGSLIEVVVDGGRWSLAGTLVSVVTLRCPLVGF